MSASRLFTRSINAFGFFLVLSVVFVSSTAAVSQKKSLPAIIPGLPEPSGPFGIGRVALDWVDPSRTADMAEDPATRVRLMVYLWYPTKAPAKDARGVLFPSAKAVDADPAVSKGLKDKIFGGNWPLVVSGAITSHAQENGAIARRPNTFPIVIFSPGAFMTCFQYTSAIEDLVSHGYVVAAIEHTYEVVAVAFPNGQLITYSPKRIQPDFLPAPGGTRQENEAKLMDWSRHRVDVRAADESFVLDRLIQLDRDKTSQFSRRLDLAHVAAVGHSRGGWASILACRRDDRLRACVNEDGTSGGEGLQYPGAPIPKQPILYVEVPPVLPADWVVLKQLHLTPDEWIHKWHETAFQEFLTFPAGGYFIELKPPGMVHYSFTDEVLLQSEKDGMKEKIDIALNGLRLTEEVTRTFLDQFLKHDKHAELQDSGDMTVKFFEAHH
jgi:hypothetical protein